MKKLFWLATLMAMVFPAAIVQAGVAYGDPDGGWSYVYTGDGVVADTFEALDGTWDHENGSDAWDGTEIGDPDGAPGGISSFTEGAVTFARFEDTGDPRNEGYSDPSNRKIYLTHDVSDDDPDGDLIISGVTLTFRTRLATSGLADGNLLPGGDGYYIRDGGKGTFGVRSPLGGILSFGLSTADGDDEAENPSGALLMNNYDATGGTDVDTQGGGEHRELAVEDPTAWNEFWVTIQDAGETNQYNVDIYANGSTSPESFVISGGAGSDGAFPSYLGIGVHSTAQSGIIDVDFFGYKPGIHVPGTQGTPGDFNGDGLLDAADIDALSAEVRAGTNNVAFDLTNDNQVDGSDRTEWVESLKNSYFGDANLDGEFNSGDFVSVFTVGEYEDATAGNSNWADGDWDGDGDFGSGDFVAAFTAGGYESGPRAAVSSVPEPGSLLIFAAGALMLAFRRR